MALGFFRKRQKMIFVIMVVLMVSFLIGFQGFEMVFHRNPGRIAIGRTPEFSITLAMHRNARSDLQMLYPLARGFGGHTLEGAAFEALQFSAPRDEDQALLYAILLRQAEENGFFVSESDVDDLIREMKNNGMDFDAYAMHLRQNQGIPVKQIRGVLARWLQVCKACRADLVIPPPSRAQLMRLFRDATEKMNLQVVTIPAEKFLAGVKEPAEKQIVEWFQANKNRPAGSFAGVEAFSFGYLHPAKVDVSYLFLSERAVRRAHPPTEKQIADYLRDNQALLVKTKGEGDTAQTVPMSEEEKRAAAVEALQDQTAEAKFRSLLDRVRQTVRQVESQGENAADVDGYAEAVARMTLPADDLLARRIPVLAAEKQPLEKVLDLVARQAEPRLVAVCFPWGDPGPVKVAPDLKITLNVVHATVGEALEKIAAQIPGLPKLRWAVCDGFPDVLFPVEGVRFFPVTAGRVAGASQKELEDHPLLGRCLSRQPPASLAQLAMEVDVLAPNSQFKVGQDGPVLPVWDLENGGAVLWRVTRAVPAAAPETLGNETRQAVVRDLKLREAFEAAKQKARTIRTPADLENYARQEKAALLETGLFSRQILRSERGVLSFQPTRLTALKFLSPAVDAYVIERAFAELAPKDLSAPYSRQSDTLLTLELPCEGYVLIARRIDYLPAMEKDFEASRSSLLRYLDQQQTGQSLLQWFASDNIRRRTGFQPEEHP